MFQHSMWDFGDLDEEESDSISDFAFLRSILSSMRNAINDAITVEKTNVIQTVSKVIFLKNLDKNVKDTERQSVMPVPYTMLL